MSAFAARYEGVCAAGDPIEPGDLVVYIDDELTHVDCEGDVLVRLDRPGAKQAEVCTTCFMEKPCGCDDGQGPVAA